MGIIRNFSLIFLANGLALYVANFYIPNFSISLQLESFVIAVALLSAINLFIKPMVKLALGPILLLTLGLGSVLVNAVTIFLLDLISAAVTIDGLVTLLVIAVVVSAFNIVLSLTARFI